MNDKSTRIERHDRDIGVRRHRQAGLQERRSAGSTGPVTWRFLEPGTVVWARVAYRDMDECKIRPVVIVEAAPDGITCFPCTTSSARFGGRFVTTELHDLAAAGLGRATGVIRVGTRLQPTEVLTVAGRLSDNDLYNVSFEPPSGPVAA